MNVRYNMEYKERRGNMIEICHLTKDYGNHRGVFDMSFQIHKGEILGNFRSKWKWENNYH